MESPISTLNLILLISLISLAYTSSPPSSALTLTLRRRPNSNSTHNPHNNQFQSQIHSTIKRARYLASRSTAQTPIHPEFNDLFFIEVQVGTPPVHFEALADLGSDLVWFQCLPCNPCLNDSISIFDPSKSSTYSPLQCNDTFCNYIGHANCTTTSSCEYNYTYAVSYTSGVLSYDTLALGDNSVGTITFGCGHVNQKFGYVGGGFVGLGRGPLSFAMQLGTKLGANKFSYCLPSLNDQSTASSPMIFGEDAGFSGAQPIPLPPNPASPSYWYLPIKGFTVAGAPVHLPNGTFAINPNGSGGMIIDTGANILLLFKVAYDAIVSAIKNATNVPPVDAMAETGSDLCYNGDDGDLKVAPLGFVFEGGAELVLPLENYMVKAGVGLKYLCFAAAVTPETFSVMGNIAQQNIHFLFDHDSFTFAFRHAHCDQL